MNVFGIILLPDKRSFVFQSRKFTYNFELHMFCILKPSYKTHRKDADINNIDDPIEKRIPQDDNRLHLDLSLHSKDNFEQTVIAALTCFPSTPQKSEKL